MFHKKSALIILANIISLTAYANNGSTSNNTITPPTLYSEQLANGANLTTSNDLYFATGIESAPLYFSLNNLNVDTTVNFSIKTISNSQSNNITPKLIQDSCFFSANKTKPCMITIDLNDSKIGSYQIIPRVSNVDLSGININIVEGSSVTLPDGKYIGTVPLITRYNTTCEINDSYSEEVEISNGNFCIYGLSKYPVCTSNRSIPIPNGPNSYIAPETNDEFDGYAYNTSWDGTTLNLNWAMELCPGFSMPLTLSLQNK